MPVGAKGRTERYTKPGADSRGWRRFAGTWALVLVAGAVGPPARGAAARLPGGGATAVSDRAAPDPERAPVVVVAIDPGHGGTNLGAAGPVVGVYEKNVTLALGKRIRAIVEGGSRSGSGDGSEGGSQRELEADLESGHAVADPAAAVSGRARGEGVPIAVVLCRASDELVPIRARVRCAAEAGAALFISLHANAVPPGVSPAGQSGFEVFVLGPREVEGDAALAALEEEDAPAAAFASHEVRASAEQSILLARILGSHLTGALGSAGWRGVKQSGAALDVLRGTRTPAALVEVGFLSHPEEGLRLATPEGREPIAQAIADAIREYAESRSKESPPTHHHGSVHGWVRRVSTRP